MHDYRISIYSLLHEKIVVFDNIMHSLALFLLFEAFFWF